MKAFTRIRKLFGNDRGNVLVIGAATMPLLIGAAAVGVDTIQLSLWKRQLQRMADSHALAGAHALIQSKSVADAVARDRLVNNQLALLGAPTIENAPTTGPFTGNARAVRVVLNAQQDLPFWRFFQNSSPTVTVEATAMVVRTGTFCLLTLEEAAVTAINFSGNATVNLGCGIATNAAGVPAIDAGGSAVLTANPIMAVGGLDATNDYFGTSTILPYSEKQKDPFADRPDPSEAASTMDCDDSFDQDATIVLDEVDPAGGPAACFDSMSIDKALTLPAGTYYIKDGNLNLGSHANVTATGVTIVFTGTGDSIGTFDMNGQAQITLKAPTTGPYADIAIYRDDDRVTMDTQHINGGNEINIEGAIYMPKTHLWINGNSTLASTCLQIVSQRITFKGNMTLTNSCATKPGSMFELADVRLVR